MLLADPVRMPSKNFLANPKLDTDYWNKFLCTIRHQDQAARCVSQKPAISVSQKISLGCINQYLRQLRKAEGGLSGMNTPQAGDLVEHLAY